MPNPSELERESQETPSELVVSEEKQSAQQANADLAVPDPTPEEGKKIIEKGKKYETTAKRHRK
jgi:cell shape-determining protein MreC